MNISIPSDAVIVQHLEWLLRTSLSAAGVAGLVLLAQFLFGRWLTPAWRYRLWGLVVLRLLLPAVPPSATSIWNAGRLVPANWSMAGPRSERSPATSADGSTADDEQLRHAKRADMVVTYGAVPPLTHAAVHPATSGFRTQDDRSWPSPRVLLAVWIGVASLLFGRVLISNLVLSRRLRGASQVRDARVLHELDRCCRAAGVSRRPMLCITDVVRVPAAAGLWRPRILLPSGLLDRLSNDELRAVLLHELAHIRCRDIAINWVLALLHSMHWFNPVVWLAFARLRADREAARDAMVLRLMAGQEPAADSDANAYGGTLLKVAESLAPARGRIGVMAGMAGLFGGPAVLLPSLFGRGSGLQRRLVMIARFPYGARRRSWIGPGLMVLLAAAALTRAKDPPMPATTAPAGLPVKLIAQPGPYEALYGTVPPELQAQLDRILPELTFDSVGLSDVLDFLRDVSGAKINVNWKALEAAGVMQSTPVTARFRNIKFSKALSIILDAASGGREKIGYEVQNGAILISTLDELGKAVEVRVYDIRDLLAAPPASQPAPPSTRAIPSREQQVAQLIHQIEQAVAPASWQDQGGPSHARIGEADGQLIVTQTRKNQAAILAFLRQWRDSRALRMQVESQLVRCDERTVNDLLAGWHKTVAQPPYSAAEAGIILDDAQGRELLHACEAAGSGNRVSPGPPLTLFNGQQAAMQFAPDNRHYISGYKPATAPLPKGQKFLTVFDEARAGVFYNVQTTANGDAKEVVLGVRLKASVLLRIERVPWPVAPVGSDLRVESPQMKSTELQTTASVPSGQNLLVGGLEDFGVLTGGSPDEHRGDTGYRLFMLIHPKIVIPPNVTSQPAPPPAEGGAR